MVSIRVLFLVIVLTCLMMAISLWVSIPNTREHSLRKWTGALVAASFAFSLYAMRDWLPVTFIMITATTSLTLTVVVGASAILDFQGQPLPKKWYVIPPLLIAIFNAAFLSYPTPRVVISGLLFAAVVSVLASLVMRGARKRPLPAYRLIVGGAAVCAMLMIARSVMGTFTALPQSGAPEGDWFWIITFFAAFTCVVSSTIGFILLHKEQAEMDVRELAMTDSLTGIYNRRTFFELAEMEFGRARRVKSALSLMMIDLDHFKAINDTHGHIVGDNVLKHVVNVITDCLRAEDLFVRYGGEEFSVLVAGISNNAATALAERVRHAVENSPMPVAENPAHKSANNALPVTVSIGMATLIPDANNSIATLIARADEAMYAAKNAGRNRVAQWAGDDVRRSELEPTSA
jgi:diguanylate cyclase (GGDEF)-like protein